MPSCSSLPSPRGRGLETGFWCRSTTPSSSRAPSRGFPRTWVPASGDRWVPGVIAICLVSGPSGSGKTTLVERLIPALAARGVPTATVKHHRGRIEVDQPGKDTWRHRRAGARATFFVTAEEVIAFLDRPPDLVPADLARL